MYNLSLRNAKPVRVMVETQFKVSHYYDNISHPSQK